jgi:hypothetical protein
VSTQEPTDQAPKPEDANSPKKSKKPKPEVPKFDTPEALLNYLREQFPATFPPEGKPPVPLMVGIRERLVKRGYAPDLLDTFLEAYVTATAYLEAVAAGQHRVNLLGELKNVPSKGQREQARQKLADPSLPRLKKPPVVALSGEIAPAPPSEKKTVPTFELTALQAKIAFTIDAETFRKVLDVDSVGAKTVPVSIVAEGRKYTANLNPKSFRKAQAAFREATQPVVTISGNLKGQVVESAGIQVFDKGAKAA